MTNVAQDTAQLSDLNVLSLFDGMSCGRLALERAGFSVGTYYASEIDKFANREVEANWPNTIQLGDVTGWRDWDIDWSSIDLLLGGSPCQGFSFAGKQLAFDDPRSKLFFVYVDILNHIKSLNPNVKFLLENVRMKKEYLDVISNQLGVQPVFINSALVSAQSRQRYYWANWEFGQPEDRDVVLADIIDDGFVDRDKSLCILANYSKGTNPANYFKKSRFQIVFYPAAVVGRRLNDQGKRDDYNKDIPITQMLEVGDGVKSRCLSTVSKDCLIAAEKPGKYVAKDTINYRKLTVVECCRLQTVPDDYFKVSSNTQAYKMLGNGWTVDVISWILSKIK